MLSDPAGRGHSALANGQRRLAVFHTYIGPRSLIPGAIGSNIAQSLVRLSRLSERTHIPPESAGCSRALYPASLIACSILALLSSRKVSKQNVFICSAMSDSFRSCRPRKHCHSCYGHEKKSPHGCRPHSKGFLRVSILPGDGDIKRV